MDKKKVLVYFIEDNTPFWLTFDYENNFSIYTKGTNVGIVGYYPLNKMYYFRETNEIVVLFPLITGNIDEIVKFVAPVTFVVY